MRTLQAYLVMCQVKLWAAALKVDGAAASVVLCGDLNCRTPGEDVLALLAGRAACSASYEWVYGRNVGRRNLVRGAKCTAPIGRYGDTCPNAAEEGSDLCWDHRCGRCGGAKLNYFPACGACASSTVPQDGPSPLPLDGPFFAPQLALPEGLGLRNACEDATGTSAFMRLTFNPKHGKETPSTFVECRDHILCSRDMRVASVLPPPALESIRGLPNLCWPSDHLALVADLAWEAPVEASSADSAAAPSVKRQKSDPAPRPAGSIGAARIAVPPRAMRSWGESSLRGALPCSLTELRGHAS